MSETQNTCLENPENTFRALDVELPAELTQEIHEETRNQLIDCFIETLHIDTPLVAFKEIFIAKLRGILQDDPLLLSDTNGAVFQEFVYQAAQEYLNNNPTFVLDPEQSYIVINNYAINFSRIWQTSDSWISSSPRPQARPEKLSLSHMEGENGFQREVNNGLTLSNALELGGFSPYIEDSLNQIFWKTLTEYELSQILLSIRFTTGIETYGWYNIVNENSENEPEWYFQYQKNDGVWKKEIYNFQNEQFESSGNWEDDDIEVKDLNGESKWWTRRVWWYSSYDIALMSIPENIRNMSPNFLREYENISQPENQSPISLSAEEQIILFISDSYQKPGGAQFFERVFLWDTQAIAEMYAHNHHRDTSDRSTAQLVERKTREILWQT